MEEIKTLSTYTVHVADTKHREKSDWMIKLYVVLVFLSQLGSIIMEPKPKMQITLALNGKPLHIIIIYYLSVFLAPTVFNGYVQKRLKPQ